MEGWEYNGHRSQKGNRKSDRRWQVGSRDNQKPFIWIVTSFDDEWNPTNKVTTKDDMLNPIVDLEDAFTPSADATHILSRDKFATDSDIVVNETDDDEVHELFKVDENGELNTTLSDKLS
jgi:hypothetical protein